MDFFSELRAFLRPPKRGTPLRAAGVIALAIALLVLLVRAVGFGQDFSAVVRAVLNDPIWLAIGLLAFATWAFFASARQEEIAVDDAERRLTHTRNAISNIGRVLSLESGLPQVKNLHQQANRQHELLMNHIAGDQHSAHWETHRERLIQEVEMSIEALKRHVSALMADMPDIEPSLQSPSFMDYSPPPSEFSTERERARWKALCYRRMLVTENVLIHQLDTELRQRREALLKTGSGPISPPV